MRPKLKVSLKHLTSMSLAQRVAGGFVIMLALSMVLSWVSISGQRSLGLTVERVAGFYSQLLNSSGRAMNNLQNANRLTNQYAITFVSENLPALEQQFFEQERFFQEEVESLDQLMANNPELSELLVMAREQSERALAISRDIQSTHNKRIEILTAQVDLTDQFEPRMSELSSAANKFKKANKDAYPKLEKDIEFVVYQGTNADAYLKRMIGILDSDRVWVMKNNLDRYIRYMEKKTEVIARKLPEVDAALGPSIAHFREAISGEQGLLSTHFARLDIETEIQSKVNELAMEVSSAVETLESLNRAVYDASKVAQEKATADIQSNQTQIFALSALSLMIALFIVWRTVATLKAAMRPILGVLTRVSEGDLTNNIPVKNKDELGQISLGINQLILEMNDILGAVKNSSGDLRNIGRESDQASQTTTKLVDEQLRRIQGMTKAMAEMEQAIAEVARASEQSSSETDAVVELALSNQTNVANNIELTGRLNSDLSRVTDEIGELKKKTDNIWSIVDTISGIAEQTNLLALNAAIEAARAGEQGRGFSVVADEVRNLANRTQESTNEINQMIEGLQKTSNQVFELIRSNRKNVDGLVGESEKAGADLNIMVTRIQSIKDMSASIATSAEEQEATVRSLSTDMSSIMNQSTHVQEESKSLAEHTSQLNVMADEQHNRLKRFKLSE